jgi:hypothetical protein
MPVFLHKPSPVPGNSEFRIAGQGECAMAFAISKDGLAEHAGRVQPLHGKIKCWAGWIMSNKPTATPNAARGK